MKEVSIDRIETAYCGLWCGGCISGNRELFHAARRLKALLEEADFSGYAAYKVKAKTPVPEFAEYETFERVLAVLPGIECSPTCYLGPCSERVGCTPECMLRVCVQEKGIDGCWECGGRENCGAFQELSGRHTELAGNIECLRRYGVDNWVRHREETDSAGAALQPKK